MDLQEVNAALIRSADVEKQAQSQSVVVPRAQNALSTKFPKQLVSYLLQQNDQYAELLSQHFASVRVSLSRVSELQYDIQSDRQASSEVMPEDTGDKLLVQPS